MGRKRKYILERTKKVGECWLWQLGTHGHGYGTAVFDGKSIDAHRLSFQAFKGKIPPGLLVCHTCDVPACCRPSHLFLGTHQDNSDDMAAKGRSTKGRRVNTGSKHGNARLDEEMVLMIRELCESGKSQASVERELGLSTGLVNKIVRRKMWNHI
jgi:hypothetical protein